MRQRAISGGSQLIVHTAGRPQTTAHFTTWRGPGAICKYARPQAAQGHPISPNVERYHSSSLHTPSTGYRVHGALSSHLPQLAGIGDSNMAPTPPNARVPNDIHICGGVGFLLTAVAMFRWRLVLPII